MEEKGCWTCKFFVNNKMKRFSDDAPCHKCHNRSEWKPKCKEQEGEMNENRYCADCRYALANNDGQIVPDAPCMSCFNCSKWEPVRPDHYKMNMDVIDFCRINSIPFAEGNVIKYVCRYKKKNGIEDLKKARTYIDRLIEAEEKEDQSGSK